MTAVERPNNRLPGMRGIIVQAGSGAPESEGGYVGLYIQLDSFETLRDFPFNVYHLDVEVVRSADLLNLLLHMAELEAENARLLSIMPPTAGAADPRFVGQGDWAVFADKVVAERDQLREDVRQAVADYMCSEGCSCCQDVGAHKRHAERLAQLLEVPKYEDRSGYNFYQYRSLSEEESS